MAAQNIRQYPLLIYQNRRIDSANLLQLITGIEKTLKRFEQENSKSISRLAFKSSNRFLSSLLLYTAAVFGRTVLPMAADLSVPQQKIMCEQAAIDLLISDDEIEDAAFTVISCRIYTELINGTVETQSDDFLSSLEIHIKFELIIATSGSTSKAKLVLLDRNNIVAHVSAIQSSLQLKSDASWLNCLPLSNVAGVMILFRCLLSGACHYLQDEFDASQIWHAIRQRQVSHISVVPIMLSRLLDAADLQIMPDSFKVMLVGGDRISNSLYAKARQAGWPVLVSYGMSETSSTVALSNNNYQYQLLEGFQLAFDDRGAIKLKGPAVMTSQYMNQASDEPLIDQQGWFTTRDLGEPDNGGFIIHGRLDYSFTSGGQTLSLEAVEQQLLACPFLKAFRLTKVSHEDWGETLVAFVEGNIPELENWCHENLYSLYCPRYFFSIDRLPVNEMGKIQKEEINCLVEQVNASKNNPA